MNCGTGNFLYVTLELLKRLEGEVLETLADLGEKQDLLALDVHTVDPHQFLGLEINPLLLIVPTTIAASCHWFIPKPESGKAPVRMRSLPIVKNATSTAVPTCASEPYVHRITPVINNGLAPPDPANVVDHDTYHADVYVRNVGCPPAWPAGSADDSCAATAPAYVPPYLPMARAMR